MMETNGLKVIEEGSMCIKAFSHRKMRELITQEIIDERVLEGLYRIIKYMPQFGSEIYVNFKYKNKIYIVKRKYGRSR